MKPPEFPREFEETVCPRRRTVPMCAFVVRGLAGQMCESCGLFMVRLHGPNIGPDPVDADDARDRKWLPAIEAYYRDALAYDAWEAEQERLLALHPLNDGGGI